MAGFGTMAFGLGPFGLGTPASADAPPTGPIGVRYLNPATGDFEVNSDDGQLAQMPTIRQRVLLALLTVRGSAMAAPDFGLVRSRKVGPSFEAEREASARSSLRQMTDVERVLRIDAVVVE